MPLGGESVRRDEREARNEADGLPQNVIQRSVVRAVIIGIEGENTAGQLVHDVAAGSLENHILGKPGWHAARAGHDVVEALLLCLRGQGAEQQQIRDLLIAERAVPPVGRDDIFNADAAVIQLAGHGDALTVHHIIALHTADLADADENARAVCVAQAALDALVFKNTAQGWRTAVQCFRSDGQYRFQEALPWIGTSCNFIFCIVRDPNTKCKRINLIMQNIFRIS